MRKLYSLLTDFERQQIDFKSFCGKVNQNRIVPLYGSQSTVLVGEGLGLKINTSVGLNKDQDYHEERRKIRVISEHGDKPDIMMDLSTIKVGNPLYLEIIRQLGCPVGTIPYYTCFDSACGIDDVMLLEEIEKEAESGVSFMTLHLTANLLSAERATSRNIPIISRGGSLLLRDLKKNRRSENVLLSNLPAILAILKKNKVAISMGSTFRSSTQYDALDDVHCNEIQMQFEIAERLLNEGIAVIMEGIGHISMNRIPEFCAMLRNMRYIPFMPLGPIVSDNTQGYDHITSAIGSAYLAALGGADIINTVTREEHTGGIPTLEAIIEAIDAANVVVKTVNESRFPSYFSTKTGKRHNCLGVSATVGCSRCNEECPFIWNEIYSNF